MPDLCKSFSGLVHLLQSDMMLHLLHLVLTRADDLKSRCFSESQVHKVLYLIGMGLLEEERLKKTGDTSFKFSERGHHLGMLQALETLSGSYRIESHKELLAWTVKMFKRALGLLTDEAEAAEETEEEDEEVRKKRARAAAERRKKIMAQMASQQKNFMVENSKLFDETPSERDRLVSTTEWEEEEEEETCDQDSSYPVCLGPHRSQASSTETLYVCILCQEEENLAADCNTLVMASYVQKSTVLAKVRGGHDKTVEACVSSSTFPFLSATLSSSPHTSSWWR